MAYFVFRRPHQATDEFERLKRRSGEAGLTFLQEITNECGTIDIFTNPSRTYPIMLESSRGEYVLAFGIMGYRGTRSTPALRLLNQDYLVGNVKWASLIGQFTVLILGRTSIAIIGDPIGANKIYHTNDKQIVSNSFLAIVSLLTQPHFSKQECFEYVFTGSCYGGKTFVRTVDSVGAGNTVIIEPEQISITSRSLTPIYQTWSSAVALDEVAMHYLKRLEHILDEGTVEHRGSVALSLSGGYDSRLILATLLKMGIRPRLFTYGSRRDGDVITAKEIAAREGLTIEHVDKSLEAASNDDESIMDFRLRWFVFDGWTTEGLFLSRSDYVDRVRRQNGHELPVNGSLGEIFRNFFFLADQPYSPGDVVSCFYSQYDPRFGGSGFSERDYREILADKIRVEVGAVPGLLSRAEVERVYTEFRGRYWTSRDVQLNQRFGPMLYPFLEASLIAGTPSIPVRYKSLGILQGRMIDLQWPSLAKVRLTHGDMPGAPKGRLALIGSAVRNRRPMFLRRHSYRIKYDGLRIRSRYFSQDSLRGLIDTDFPYMRNLFIPEAVNDDTMYDRLATLEFLAQELNFGDLGPG